MTLDIISVKRFLNLIVFGLLIQLNCCSNDTEWFRNEMTTKVVTHYQVAYKMLNDGIIQTILNFNVSLDTLELLEIDDGQNETSETYRTNRLTTLADQLDIAANNVYTNLNDALSECQRLRNQLQQKITSTTLAISQRENELHALDINIAQLSKNVHEQEQQVAFAEQAVRDRQTAVNDAARRYQDADDRVDDARLCRDKRRIGGWLGKNSNK